MFEILNKTTEITFYCGNTYFSSVSTSSKAYSKLAAVETKNIFLLRKLFLFQYSSELTADLFDDNVRVVELNPRCLTSWCSLLSSKILRRGKTIVWGHLFNRAGVAKRYSARNLMLKIANGALFYTKGQMDSFKALRISANTISGYAPNSVIYANQVVSFDEAGTDFIYVGRLVQEKKPSLLLDAFITACSAGLDVSHLHIVGDGPDLDSLKDIAAKSRFRERIHFYGHSSDYGLLKSLYERSVCSISPGYVGLSITQSFSFGRPMIISRDEPHAPEIEAFLPGENGEFFTTDDVAALAQKLTEFYQERQYWAAKSASMARQVLDNYTYEAMAAGYLNLIERVKNHG